MKKPPKKLSKLVRLALNDLAKAERSKRLIVNMSTWHVPTGQGQCEVCFAGSVMAKTLKFDNNENIEPWDSNTLTREWSNAFDAINRVRQGDVEHALMAIGIGRGCRGYRLDRDVVPYHSNSKLWRKQMWQIVRDLEREGL